jgi:hypothetical protein
MDSIDERIKDLGNVEKELEEEDMICQPCFEEPERLRKLPVICGPSDKEREIHERYHIPYRSWCEICVQAKKKNIPHYSVKDKRTFPVISMDYMFFSDKSAVLILKDANFGGVWALVVIRKGNGGEYAATRVADIINKLGYPRCILKCDQEPALVDVSKEIRKILWSEMKDISKLVKEKHDGEIVIIDDDTPVEIIQPSRGVIQ